MRRVNSFDYANTGGTLVFQQTVENVNIKTTKGSGYYNNGGYTYVGTIKYNKMKNTATLTMSSSSTRHITQRTVSFGVFLDMLLGETKDEYAERLAKYPEQHKK